MASDTPSADTVTGAGATSEWGAPNADAARVDSTLDNDVAYRALDMVSDGVVIAGRDGSIGYRNVAAARLLDDADPALYHAIDAAVAGTATRGATVCEAECDGQWFELRPLAFVASDGAPHVLVVITCTSSRVPSVGLIAQRHGLTLREAAVARLLAEGHRNDVIAERLSIRETTARHYTERILMKLATRSRGEAAAIVLGTKVVRAPQGRP